MCHLEKIVKFAPRIRHESKRDIVSPLPMRFMHKFKHKLRLFCCGVPTLQKPCGDGGKSGGSTKHSVTYKPYVAPPYQSHDLKNMTLKRPMSPHLTVYAPAVTSMTSIFQRITGTMTAISALLMSFGTLFLSNGVETYVCIIQSMNLGSFSIFLLKLILGFPFAYHYCNGIRYSGWVAGKGLDIPTVYATAKKALIGGAVIAFLFALL